MHLLNTYQSPIRWTDLDAYAHLNNAIYFDFMSEARATLLTEALAAGAVCQFVVAHVECDYKAPYFYPDTVIVKQYCEEIGRSSFLLFYEFYSEKRPELLCAQAKARMVAYDPVAQKVVRLPENVLELLKGK